MAAVFADVLVAPTDLFEENNKEKRMEFDRKKSSDVLKLVV